MSTAPDASRPSNQELVQTVRTLREEIRTLDVKVSQLIRDSEEYGVVMETLKKAEPSRKCFRLIGGVLVARTVEDILPGLDQQKTNIDEVSKSLASHYQKKGVELQEYQKKWNIKITNAPL
ncbi:hypothetical protein CROQUDRAFT_664146 [Cronartium quercuum f. sp. fusiforme G11]|uniref:Prefoldin subunit 2 n=1 Tax=Cronartium quercuum f. sp. fusiforme G11 TaxID=708437 RepID=A0A9P6N7E5_9BASI|nr:hypothetical protein CROQUDRAFT_664146 [Cronartium quercuum f. sp. fusiforme G11]